MSIVVRIEKLVLHGFAAGDGGRIAGGLADELERLIATQGLPAGLIAAHEAARIDAGEFLVPSGARPEQVGAIIARRVYGAPPERRRLPAAPEVEGTAP